MRRTLRQDYSASPHQNSSNDFAFHPAEDLSRPGSPVRSFPNHLGFEEQERERRYRGYAGHSDYEEEDTEKNNYKQGAGSEQLGLPLYHNSKAMNAQSEQLDIRPGGGTGMERRRRPVGSDGMTARDNSAVYLDEEQDGMMGEKSQYGDRDEQGKVFGSKGHGLGPRTGGVRGIPLLTNRRPDTILGWIEANEELFFTVLYTALALFTRLYKIGIANYVVWDEAHFGKFGSHYINRDFYFDVHPPLGKMLVGLAGLLSGYNGGFDFKSGLDYPNTVPYTAMRVLMAMYGVGMIPVAWWTAGELGWSRQARHLVTLCVLFDVGWLCISRFILLDSMLLFFTFTAILGLVKFHNQRHDPFGEDWWLWLAFTGLQIGCVCSVKWVGLFGATALIGLYTIEDLWNKFGDVKMPFVSRFHLASIERHGLTLSLVF